MRKSRYIDWGQYLDDCLFRYRVHLTIRSYVDKRYGKINRRKIAGYYEKKGELVGFYDF
jgi:hypothetical protein